MGLGGHEESRVGSGGSFLTALDYDRQGALAPQVSEGARAAAAAC